MSLAAAWPAARGARRCAVTGNPIGEGELFFSALLEEGDSMARRDYAESAWAGVDRTALHSWWKNRPRAREERGKRRIAIDGDACHALFESLEDAAGRRERLLRHALALILLRKRAFRLEEIQRSPDGPVLRVFDRRAGRERRVEIMDADPGELAGVEADLIRLLER